MEREAIIDALKNRLDSVADSYAQYRNTTTNLGLRKLIESLLEQEHEYAKEIDETGKTSSPEKMLTSEAETSQKFDKLLAEVEKASFTSDIEMLKNILREEQKTATLFELLSGFASSEDIEYQFKRMRDEEKKHAAWIQDRIDLLELAG